MANPQKKNGYTPIANEILEQLYKLALSGIKFRVLMVIFRYTYGFSRKEHGLSETFITEAIGANRRSVRREIRSLIDSKIISVIREGSFNSPRIIAFNKDYDQWVGVKSPSGGENDTEGNSIPEGEEVPSPEGKTAPTTVGEMPPQENKYKTNIKKIYTCEFEKFWSVYPRKVEKAKAFASWKTRLKEGVNHEQLIQASINYSDQVKGTDEKYIKHPSTFLGSNKSYEDYLYEPKASKNDDLIYGDSEVI